MLYRATNHKREHFKFIEETYGPDGISGDVLKFFEEPNLDIVSHIFNEIYDLEEI